MSRWLRRVLYGLMGIYLVFIATELWQFAQGNRTDPMLTSGGLACLVSLYLSLEVGPRMRRTVAELRDSGVLSATAEQLNEFNAALETEGRRQAKRGALTVGVAEALTVIGGFLLVPWLIYGVQPLSVEDDVLYIGVKDAVRFVSLLIACIAGGAVSGWFLGLLAAYGRFQVAAELAGCRLRLQTAANDGMGGFRPFVSFLRGQAVFTLVPVVWISAWLILTVFGRFEQQYGIWRFPLLMLLGLAVFYSIVGFYQPRRMVDRVLHEQSAIARQFADRQRAESVVIIAEAAQKRMWPTPRAMIALLAVLLIAILVAGVVAPQGGSDTRTIRFFFGPR